MRLLLVIGSVRPGRLALPIATWVADRIRSVAPDVEVDVADLAELALPLMDEPHHPRLQQYTKPHTIAWSERVTAADATILVSPEYNHSYAPALKNALDYLSREWLRMPVGLVSYGGVSAGTRAAAALAPVLASLGMIKTTVNLEMNFAGARVHDGVYDPSDSDEAKLDAMVAELEALAFALRPVRAA